MRFIVALFIILCLEHRNSVSASLIFNSQGGSGAQDNEVDGEEEKGILDKLAAHGVEIRKSFEGTVKELGVPASASYANSDLSGTFYGVDLGIKLANWQPPLKTGTLLFFPLVEWHRSTAEGEEKNKVSAGLNLEYFLDTPFFLLASKFARDFQADTTSVQASALASLFREESSFGPGAPIRTSSEALVGRYYPYLGIEYFDNLPFKRGQEVLASEITAWFTTGRLQVSWFPFNQTLDEGRLQVHGTYTFRRKIDGDLPEDSYDLLNLSLVYYLDEGQRFGIGYDYDRGEDPAANFLENTKSSVSFRLKL